MLVITSDWHLTDNTTGMRIPAGAFQLFQERLENMAYDASQRGDGTYRPVESFDLVLLGDIFDLERTTAWLDEARGAPGYARPWTDPNDPALAAKIDAITDKIIAQNAASLEILRAIADGDGISLPPATEDHQADLRVSRDHRSKSRLPVKVNIHYMIGNHDWYYHLPGAAFDRVRQKIVAAMHLSNAASPFPYDLAESPALEQVFDQHSVYARHGDCYDASNYHDPDNAITPEGRNHASLGDAMCVELFNPIGKQIREVLAGQLPDDFFRDLDEMGSIRPDLLTPVWIASLLERYQASTGQRKIIDDIWHDLVAEFLKLDFLDELDQPFQFDLVDKVTSALKFSKLIRLDTLADFSLAVNRLGDLLRLIKKSGRSFEAMAAQEDAYLTQRARFIVYGHTHRFLVYPLRSELKKGAPFDQLYINSGTWHPVHDFCQADPDNRGFIFHKTMSYLGFYSGDERKCRAYETWTGTLDI